MKKVPKAIDLCAAVAQCWTAQLLLMLSLLTLSLLQAAIKDDLTIFLYDPGTPGWRVFCLMMPLYAGMSLWTRLENQPWFRKFNTVFLYLTMLLPIGHQTKHLLEGKPPDFSVTVEIMMMVVAIVGGTLARRWTQQIDESGV